MKADRRRGFTQTESVVVICVIAFLLLLAFILPNLAGSGPARAVKDATQLTQIHKTIVTFGRQFDGQFPRPGLIDRLPAEGDPDSGDLDPEDFTLNHTAPLFSTMIAQNYVAPPLVVSPIEVSPLVAVKTDYDYTQYDSVEGVYWDRSFTASIDDPAIGSNVSYAHLAFVGDRREHWSDVLDPNMPILSTRGPRDGAIAGDEYTRSPTLRFRKPNDTWVGNIGFSDGHVEMLDTFVPDYVTFDAGDGRGPQPDNIFAAEFAHPDGPHAAADAFLGVFTAASPDGLAVTPVWDPLDD